MKRWRRNCGWLLWVGVIGCSSGEQLPVSSTASAGSGATATMTNPSSSSSPKPATANPNAAGAGATGQQAPGTVGTGAGAMTPSGAGVAGSSAAANPPPNAMPAPEGPAGAPGTRAPRPSAGCGMPLMVGADEDVSTMHDGQMRAYILHFPAAYDMNKPIPFLLNLHGYTSNNARQKEYTDMNATADKRGFIVAYPAGLDASFNAGDCCGSSAGTVDDLGFMQAIVEQVGARACVDLGRVYSTGLSNGGMMSFHLACDASDVFAAIAPVVGFVTDPSCEPTRGVPILSFLGTADSIVQYSTANPQSEEWAMRNQCKAGPMMESHGASSCKVWTDCRDGAEVQVCSLMGMGHCWPGAPTACRNGTANDDMTANEAMWDFFDRFALP